MPLDASNCYNCYMKGINVQTDVDLKVVTAAFLEYGKCKEKDE